MVREIITEWTGPGSSPKLSIMYFDEASTVSAQRGALGAFWESVDNWISNLFTWTVRTEGRELDTATGALTGFWSHTTGTSGPGENVSGPVPDASQVLMRWRTGTVVNGRRLQGRTYVPGLYQTGVSQGNLASGPAADFNTAGNTLVTSSTGLVVWHRPKNGAGGSQAAATQASVWTELAVQRRRRG